MRRTTIARLLLAVMFLMTFLSPTPALAAEAPKVSLVEFTYPKTATAGDTITFMARVKVRSEVGVCCGNVAITGPSGQAMSVRLVKSGLDTVRGTLTLSKNAPGGKYTIAGMYVDDNGSDYVGFENGKNGFSHSFVVAPKEKVDTTAPVMAWVKATPEASTGEYVTVTAKVTDDLSGVGRVTATIRPNLTGQGAWSRTITLFPTNTKDEYAGAMLMDATALPLQKAFVTRVSITDLAGNGATVEGKDLTGNKENVLESKPTLAKVPKELITSPYMSVIHPGLLAYFNWFTVDYKHTLGLLRSMEKDAAGVRARLTAELPMLHAAVDSLRKELYVDPATKLKVSPLATTGKWMALNRAIMLRMELLVELERREGKSHPERHELTEDDVEAFYSFPENSGWMLLESTLLEFAAQQSVGYLKVLAQSPKAVQALKTPAFESEGYGPWDHFDRNVIYFQPFAINKGPSLEAGTSTIFVPMNARSNLDGMVRELFYQIGRHFGEAYFSAYDAQDRTSRWSEYLALRGNQTWPDQIGFTGSPENNIADDFAYTFLPSELGKQYFSYQSYPRLREEPKMAEDFKKLAEKLLARKVPDSAGVPVNMLAVGTADTFQVTAPAAGAPKLEYNGFRWDKAGWQTKAVAGTASKDQTVFQSKDTDMGRVSGYYLSGKDADGRAFFRYLYYFRAPLLLDVLPGATNKPTINVTGSAPAGKAVTVNGRSATADSKGRFSVSVPLVAGANTIKASVAGSTQTASFVVWYTVKDAKVPLKVSLPGVTKEERLTGIANTSPYAIVTVNGLTAQALFDGRFPYSLPLQEGLNKLTFSVVDVAGNTATWSGSLTRDSKAPDLSVSLPLLTNVANYQVSGTVDAGSALTVNDDEVKVGSDGTFGWEIPLKNGETKTFAFVAVDPAGNRTELTKAVTYTKDVPALTTASQVALKGKVHPALKLSFEGQPVTVNKDGTFSVTANVTAGELNSYVLHASKDDKAVGFLKFEVTSVFKAEARAEGNDRFVLSGKTRPGYTLLVDMEMVTADAQGNWEVTVSRNGRQTIPVILSGDGITFDAEVTLP